MKKLLLAALLAVTLTNIAAADELNQANADYAAAQQQYETAAGQYYELLTFGFEVEATWLTLRPVAMTILAGQDRNRGLYLEIDRATQAELAVRTAGLHLAKVRAEKALRQARTELDAACQHAGGTMVADQCQWPD